MEKFGLREQIESVLENQVRPMLNSHGGDIVLKGFEDGIVRIDFTGACAGCASADLSTKGFVEDTLKAAIPEVEGVELEHLTDPELLAMARKILSGEMHV